MRTLIIIPARLESKRLFQKPLVNLDGMPMIQRVFENLQRANIAPVWVAYDDDCIGNLFLESQRVKTGVCCSGTDRVAQALDIKKAWNQFDIVINVQGDTPILDTSVLSQLFIPFSLPEISVVTLICSFKRQSLRPEPSKVKAVCRASPLSGYWECHDFKRTIDFPDPSFSYYHHWGIYAFRPEVLKQFKTWDPSPKEQKEALEQLRFLDHGHSIWAAEVTNNSSYMCVDTLEDLKEVQDFLKKSSLNKTM
ncbi:cytidylyltransferase domain-containing protein [Holospora curviuscula]|nr:hypothetical protein [Holospora curviuscula]